MQPTKDSSDRRFACTGVGSLPFSAISDAVEHIRTFYGRWPFVPELPLSCASPAMLRRVLPESFFLSTSPRGTELRMSADDDNAPALFSPTDDELLSAPIFRDIERFAPALRAFDRHAPLRIAIVGPCTLTAALKDAFHQPLWHVATIRDAAQRLIVRIVARVVAMLKVIANDVMIQIDEPMLGHLAADREIAQETLNGVFSAVRAEGARTALHTCSRPILPLVESLSLDLLSIDLVEYADAVMSDSATFERIVANGTTIVAGVVPAFERDSTPSPVAIVESIVASLSGTSRSRFLDRLALSATCGTLLAPIDREREIAAHLEATASELRRLHPL